MSYFDNTSTELSKQLNKQAWNELGVLIPNWSTIEALKKSIIAK